MTEVLVELPNDAIKSGKDTQYHIQSFLEFFQSALTPITRMQHWIATYKAFNRNL